MLLCAARRGGEIMPVAMLRQVAIHCWPQFPSSSQPPTSSRPPSVSMLPEKTYALRRVNVAVARSNDMARIEMRCVRSR